MKSKVAHIQYVDSYCFSNKDKLLITAPNSTIDM